MNFRNAFSGLPSMFPIMLDRPEPPDSLLDILPDPALVLDTTTDLIDAMNSGAARLLGADRAERHGFARFLGREVPAFVVFLEEVEHRGQSWTRDVMLHRLDGTPLRCEVHARFLPNRPRQILLTLLDLDELDRRAAIAETASLHRAGLDEWMKAEGFFAELERRNQLILNAAGEGIYGVNAEGRTTFVNRAAQEMLGWTVEDLLGQDIHAMIHHHHLSGESYPSHQCPIYRSFRFEQVNRIEDEVFWRKDGKPIRVEYVSTPIYDQKVLAGAVVIFRDITERKEGERKLREALEEVAALRDRLEQENAYLQEAITSERAQHDIIGSSPAIRQLLTKIDLVANTEATVLISGEVGAGKALVAATIHKQSDRRRRPLIHFKCGSVAPEALEGELFGQIRGANPGAIRDRPGKLELAHGGTLFLDDIEELPIEHQGRLLHVLQTRKVTRAGDTRARALDIRLIAASTANLERMIANGTLREDLYLALNVFPIVCRPLRERTEDVPELAVHLLRMACKRLNRKVPIITERVMQRLVGYHWPGNVRELRNVIDRGAIVSQGGKLIVDLGENDSGAGVENPRIKTETELRNETRDNLVACMKEAGGRVAGANGAAALLGVPATTFYSRLRTFKVTEDDWKTI